MEEKKISSDLIRGHIDTIILYSLTDSDKFAQQISDFIEIKSEKQYQINQATLYSSLKRLESMKFVTSYWNDIGDGRRKFFKISPLGDEFVKDNLSNWSYSRVILDKLMGYDYTPSIYITQNNSVNRLENPNNSNVESKNELNAELEVKQTEIIAEKPSNISVSPLPESENITPSIDAEDKKEINFRLILNGLIKNSEKTAVKEVKPKIEITDLGKTTEDNPENASDVAKFNETIEAVAPSSPEYVKGKADFSDIAEKYALEGYKIRVSNKSLGKINGNLLINKLNLFTILFFLPFPLIELLALQFLAKIPIFSSITAILFLALNLIGFSFILVKYLLDKNKAIFRTVTFDGILNSAIIVFNLLLVIFALNFILSVDLSIKFNLFSYLLVPIIASINLILYFTIEYFLSKKQKFNYKK